MQSLLSILVKVSIGLFFCGANVYAGVSEFQMKLDNSCASMSNKAAYFDATPMAILKKLTDSHFVMYPFPSIGIFFSSTKHVAVEKTLFVSLENQPTNGQANIDQFSKIISQWMQGREFVTLGDLEYIAYKHPYPKSRREGADQAHDEYRQLWVALLSRADRPLYNYDVRRFFDAYFWETPGFSQSVLNTAERRNFEISNIK